MRTTPPPGRRDQPASSVAHWLRPFFILCIAALLIAIFVHRRPSSHPLPDFAAITDLHERKSAFIDYLTPLVLAVNHELQTPRHRLQAINAALAAGWPIDPSQRGFIITAAKHHGIGPVAEIDRALLAQLLNRVDTIPASLVIAQAAIESGWGTSRFAQQGNALFGMRCYTPGCGIVPKHRQAGAKFEVAVYPSARDAIRAYIKNLNADPRYRNLRRIRATLRSKDQPVTGAALAAGLVRYSENSEYVTLVRSVIQDNHLERLDP